MSCGFVHLQIHVHGGKGKTEEARAAVTPTAKLNFSQRYHYALIKKLPKSRSCLTFPSSPWHLCVCQELGTQWRTKQTI